MQNTFIRPLGATALVAFAISASSLHAAAYSGTTYEGFDYAAGNLLAPSGLTGGSGWNGPTAIATQWGTTLSSDNLSTASGSPFALGSANTTRQQIIGTGLSYSGLASSGGAIQLDATAGTAQVGRNFGQNVDSGTFYFSYLVQKTANTARTLNMAFFATSTAGTAPPPPVERFSIGQIAGNTNYLGADGVLITPASPLANQGDFQVLLANPVGGATPTSSIYKTAGIIERNATTNPNSVAAQPLTLNTTFMVIGKVEFDVSGVNDRLTLYLNPTSLDNEVANTAYFTATGIDFGTLAGVRIFAGANQAGPPAFTPAAGIYDEFRFGTSFSDVVVAVPEPGTAVLGGALGLLLLHRLRRRRA